MKDEKMKKNFIWNIVGTSINAFSSLFLMIMVTRINGVFDAGIFTFAFATATLFNVIGVYSGRIYQVTENSKLTDKEFLINKIISCTVMMIISTFFIIINHYSFTKSMIIMILCILKMLEAFTETLYAKMQNENNLYMVGISLTIKNILCLIAFLITNLATKNLTVSLLSFVLSYILIMLIYDFNKSKIQDIFKQKFNKHNVLSIFKDGFCAFAIAFLAIYLINSSRYAIDSLMTDNVQTIYGIIIMPATVMILFTQFIIHPFLITIKGYVKNGSTKELLNLIYKICLYIIIFGLIVVLGFKIAGIKILEIVYDLKLMQYEVSFYIVLTGAILYAMISVLTTVLIAMRHTFIQMLIYLFMSGMTYFLSIILVEKMGLVGASLSYATTMAMTLVIFIVTVLIIIKKGENND